MPRVQVRGRIDLSDFSKGTLSKLDDLLDSQDFALENLSFLIQRLQDIIGTLARKNPNEMDDEEFKIWSATIKFLKTISSGKDGWSSLSSTIDSTQQELDKFSLAKREALELEKEANLANNELDKLIHELTALQITYQCQVQEIQKHSEEASRIEGEYQEILRKKDALTEKLVTERMKVEELNENLDEVSHAKKDMFLKAQRSYMLKKGMPLMKFQMKSGKSHPRVLRVSESSGAIEWAHSSLSPRVIALNTVTGISWPSKNLSRFYNVHHDSKWWLRFTIVTEDRDFEFKANDEEDLDICVLGLQEALLERGISKIKYTKSKLVWRRLSFKLHLQKLKVVRFDSNESN